MTSALAFLLLLIATVCHGQMPVVQPLPIYTNHVSVAAVKGTNIAWANDLAVTNRNFDYDFDPSPTSDVTYIFGRGNSAGNYTITNAIGTNTHGHYPVAPRALVTTESFGDKPFLSFTGAAPEPPLFFQAYATSKGAVSISCSTDFKHWTSGYALLLTTGKNWTITRQ